MQPSIKFAFNKPIFNDRILHIVYSKTFSSRALSYKSTTSVPLGVSEPSDQTNKRKLIINENEEDDHTNNNKKCKLTCTIEPPELLEEEVLYQSIHINTMWLVAQSSFFHTMYHIDMMENSQPFIKIVLSCIEEAQLFLHIIKHIYTFELPDLDPSMLMKMIILADQYQFKTVVDSCCVQFTKVATEDLTTKDVALLPFELPDCIFDTYFENVSFQSMLDTCGDFLISKYDSILLTSFWQTKEFLQMNYHIIHKLFSSNKLQTLSENTIYVAIKYWLYYQPESTLKPQQIIQLFLCIRLGLCTNNFLIDVVSTDTFFIDKYEASRLYHEQSSIPGSKPSPSTNSTFLSLESVEIPIEPFVQKFFVENTCTKSVTPSLISSTSSKEEAPTDTSMKCLFLQRLQLAFMHQSTCIAERKQFIAMDKQYGSLFTLRTMSSKSDIDVHFEVENVAQVVTETQPKFSPVFWIDGFPFVLEISKSLRDDTTSNIGLFLFCKLKKPYMNMRVSRRFAVLNQMNQVWHNLNQTTSTFSKPTSGFGMFHIFRDLTFEEVTKAGTMYTNDEGTIKFCCTFKHEV